MNVLVVAAHPDDEVLGAGGTIARHTGRGETVYAVLLGEGITSRAEKGVAPSGAGVRDLKQNAREAASIVGIEQTFFFDFPDNRFDAVPLLDIVKAVESVKKEIRPEIVYTHHRGDLNIDHRITFAAVLTAFRPMAGESARRILSFAVPSSTEWSAPAPESVFAPNVFVDIGEHFEKKVAAMKAYRSEIREFPHPRSPEALEIYAKMWGVTVGMNYAEPFLLVRELTS
ncbi:MAG: PIG-L deacetylase family protein [Planctomycetota bacterium]